MEGIVELELNKFMLSCKGTDNLENIKFQNQSLEKLVQLVESKETSLRSIVQSLEVYLVSTESNARIHGLTCLSQLLTKLSSSISRQDIGVFLQFYLSRLDDKVTIKPNLEGLVALQNSTKFDSQDCLELITTLFDQLKIQTLNRSLRMITLNILEVGLTTHLKALQSLGDRFLQLFLQAVEGEKDPRNIVFVFQLHLKVIANFDIANLVQEFFDLTFCYFPITFKESKEDPLSVTSYDLKLSLKNLLISSPHFSSLILPALVEKLKSDFSVAKVDALEVLLEGLKVYNPVAIANNFEVLLESVVNEVYLNDPTIKPKGLEVLQTIYAQLYNYDQLNSTANLATQLIATSATKLLANDDESPTAGQILVAIAKGHLKVWEEVGGKTFPKLLLTLHTASPQFKVVLLKTLVDLLNGLRQVTDHDTQFGPNHVMVSCNSSLIDALMAASSDTNLDLKLVAITGFANLVLISNYLSDQESNYLVSLLTETLTGEADDPLRLTGLGNLVAIARHRPQLIVETTLQSFQQFVATDLQLSQLELWLEPLFRLADANHLLLQATQKLLVSYLIDPQQSSPAPTTQHLVQVSFIELLVKLITTCQNDEMKLTNFDSILVPLVGHLVTNNNFTHEAIVLSSVGRLVTSLLVQLDLQQQQARFDQFCALFRIGSFPPQWGGKDTQYFDPFRVHTTQDSSYTGLGFSLLPIFTAVLAGVRPQVQFPTENFSLESFVEVSTALILDHSLHSALGPMLAILTNKWLTALNRLDLVQNLLDRLLELAKDSNTPLPRRTSAAILIIWITKALILQGHTLGFSTLTHLLHLLDDSELANKLQGQFAKLSLDSEYQLTSDTFAVVRRLYRQRLFQHILQSIDSEELAEGGPSGLKRLSVLTEILPGIPNSIVISSSDKLQPLLVTSLSLSQQPDTQLVALKLFPQILQQSSTNLIHLSLKLIPYLLPLLNFNFNNVEIRIHALQCLQVLDTRVAKNLAKEVLLKIEQSLDDPKRLVRAEAVKAKRKWKLVGAC